MDGTGPDDKNVVAFSLARLERMIQLRLDDAAPDGQHPGITVKLMDRDLVGPSIPDDPAFYDQVVDKIMESLGTLAEEKIGKPPKLFVDEVSQPSDTFVSRLRCMSCGIVTTDETSGCETFLRGSSRGEVFTVGSRLEFSHDEVARDYYARAVEPAAGAPIHIIEGWECPHCHGVNWAEIVIRDSLVSSIWSVALSTHSLERAHYVTSECVELAARLTGQPSWALLHDEVFDLLMDELRAH